MHTVKKSLTVLDPEELEKRKKKFSTELEDNTRESLVEKMIEQEMHIENLYKMISELYSLRDLKQIIIDNDLLGSPSFLKKIFHIKPHDKLREYQGFYELEGETGNYYRWTKRNFYFDLPIDRSEEREISLQFRCKDGAENDILCYVNGVDIETSIEQSGDDFILHGVLPPEKFSTTTRISFLGDTTPEPESSTESDDPRQLFIVFEQLTIG